MPRLEGNKNTDCAAKSVIFAHLNGITNPENLILWLNSEKAMQSAPHHLILWQSLACQLCYFCLA